MNKPVYEMPMGDGSPIVPPTPGRRAAPTGYTADTPGYTPAPSEMENPEFSIPSFTAAQFPPPVVAAPDLSTLPAPSFPPPVVEAPDVSTLPAPNFPPPAMPQNSAPAPAPAFAMPAAPEPPAFTLPPATEPPAFEMPQSPLANFPPPSAPLASFPPPEAATSAAPPSSLLSDLSPSVGLGQEGSDPDLVAALNGVVTARASDLHVSVNAAPAIRVDGGLRALPGMVPWDDEKVRSALLSIMSDEQQEQFATELELDFAYTLSETSRFRVNIYQQRNSMGAAFRLIPTEIKQLEALGVPTKIGAFAQLPRGLVLVTGPTGSGKSTTLAALIDLVNATRSDHIVTVEDPIEFMHGNKKSLVNQREVGHDTHSFANALKHVLRQDPDVILIGELRDLETISVALTAAETGHLVFATLHTQDAAQTIDRVIDVFPPHQQGQVRAQLAATLQGVVCQTLIKRAHGGGRAVATEVLIMTPAISNLIREGKTYQIHSAMQAGRESGMHTMDQHLADLVNGGQITHQSAYDKAHDLEDLKLLISRAGGDAAPARSSNDGPNYNDSFSGAH